MMRINDLAQALRKYKVALGNSSVPADITKEGLAKIEAMVEVAHSKMHVRDAMTNQSDNVELVDTVETMFNIFEKWYADNVAGKY